MSDTKDTHAHAQSSFFIASVLLFRNVAVVWHGLSQRCLSVNEPFLAVLAFSARESKKKILPPFTVDFIIIFF